MDGELYTLQKQDSLLSLLRDDQTGKRIEGVLALNDRDFIKPFKSHFQTVIMLVI